MTEPLLDSEFEFSGAVVRYGRFGTGPPVVLCHGTPWSSFSWRHVVDAIASDWTVFVWDMLGYGRSEKHDGDISLRAQGQLLAELVREWALDRPHVIAHDYGGAVALRAHLLHDVPFSSLLLADVVALRPWGSPFFRLVSENASVFSALPPNLHEALLREYIGGASSAGLDPDVVDELVAPWSGAGQSGFYRQIAQADEAQTAEFEPLLSTIDIPTRIIWGADDLWIPPDRAERLARTIPGSTVQLIPAAGHLVQEDQPEIFTAAITRWLRDQS